MTASSFVSRERAHQAAFHRSDWFDGEPRTDGVVELEDGAIVGPTPFFLPPEYAAENLFLGIRDQVLAYFKEKDVAWHMETPAGPSNHMLDSQVCCVNFLAPFMHRPHALEALLRSIFADVGEAIVVSDDEPYIAFEWIGPKDYLGEWKKEQPTRGRMVTSADAAVRFKTSDGRIHLVLIEWKYTESYPGSEDPGAKDMLAEPGRGKKRRLTYAPLLHASSGPIDLSRVAFEDLFFEPVYQLMRQQLLASQIERHEEDVDLCSVLHISPQANTALGLITPRQLRVRYEKHDLLQLWPTLLTHPADGVPRFRSVGTEELFRSVDWSQFADMATWWNYVQDRYAGILGKHKSETR